MPTPFHRVLDAGDQLVEAVLAGDLSRAAAELRTRAELIEALRDSPAPPSPDLVERFRQQDIQLGSVLRGGLRSLADEMASTSRTVAAAGVYARQTAAPSLDTARR